MIICLSYVHNFLILYNLFKSLIPKNAGTFPITLRFMTPRHHVSIYGSMLQYLLYATSPQKQETDFSLVLKDSDTESENLSSFSRLSVSDSQKTDSSNVASFIGK